MVRCIFLVAFLLGMALHVSAQDPVQVHETARSFMRQNDYANAVLVLNRGLQVSPGNVPMLKDLSLCYYFQGDHGNSLQTILPLLNTDSADDQCYQIACNAYKEQGKLKDCEKLLKKGLKKFPLSGALYNETGELLWGKQDYDAIQYWEKGIEKDPSYSKNYYNAARYYYLTTDKVWSILYGEIFANMEPQSSKTPEIKEILLNSYKKLFAEASILAPAKEKNGFTKMFYRTMGKQSGLLSQGLDMESLLMIRARFILEWAEKEQAQYPFRLFEYQQQLLREGLFEAYQQWLFGPSHNLAAFQSWTKNHPQEYNQFLNFQRGRLFKMPTGQYHK